MSVTFLLIEINKRGSSLLANIKSHEIDITPYQKQNSQIKMILRKASFAVLLEAANQINGNDKMITGKELIK